MRVALPGRSNSARKPAKDGFAAAGDQALGFRASIILR